MTDDVTLSWQVRSSAVVRLRLYRTQPGGRDDLVGEFVATPGIRSFEHVDHDRPPGSMLYELRIVDDRGSETTLGSVMCVEPGMAAAGAPSVGSIHARMHAETRDLTVPTTIEAGTAFPGPMAIHVGFYPAPDPPVPRRGTASI
jgi:hypothetical protein